jgi:hypothetical protein
MLTVTVVGMIAIAGLAVVVGVLESRSQRAGWLRIAEIRHELAQWERMLKEREEQLAKAHHDLDEREEGVNRCLPTNDTEA